MIAHTAPCLKSNTNAEINMNDTLPYFHFFLFQFSLVNNISMISEVKSIKEHLIKLNW